jgi:hypothetical protein
LRRVHRAGLSADFEGSISVELRWFNFPRGGGFSLPTEWWIEAGMDRFDRGEDLSYADKAKLNMPPSSRPIWASGFVADMAAS